MPLAVVTGANSGIGNAFAQLLISEGYEVVAADVTIGEKIKELGCAVSQLDITLPESIAGLKEKLADEPVDVLLNIAGVMSPAETDSLTTTSPNVLARTFAVNTFGPLLLTQALLPNLRKSSSPRIGIMSSRVGSIADNGTGGMYAYRASKAAVNSVGKSMAVDLKGEGVIVVLMHPGYVRTGLDTTTHGREDAVEAAEAAEKLWKVFLSKEIEDTGKFWHREGMELPW